MSEFHTFATRAHERFNHMSEGELFVVDIDGDTLWAEYLAAFPEGTNPIYITNTEHDCSCCRNFIKNIGNVIAISDSGKRRTIWDMDDDVPEPYAVVAYALDKLVRNAPIVSVFRPTEPSYGAEQSRMLKADGTVHVWKHFHAKIFSRHLVKEPATKRGELNTTARVFERGLKELTEEALLQVRELIDSNALYRGAEHDPALREFVQMKSLYMQHGAPYDRADFVWANIGNRAARFRNTVIGTLVRDLSEGVDMEQAVRSFEQNVAPTNYKRPTALITPRMVESAMKTIGELGLEPALERRFANIGDVSVNDVLWVDNADRVEMKGGVRDVLMAAAQVPTTVAGEVKEISVGQFLSLVMPKATSISMLVKNAHLGNFVSLTAPVHAHDAQLFKWGNNFGWSYDGNITDSIRERVKKAGGNVDAKLRFSLSWFNYDDLDLHVKMPDGETIYFRNPRVTGRGAGVRDGLDVDMNAGMGRTREGVENISFSAPKDGFYQVSVNNFCKRESSDVGFTIEVASGSGVMQCTYKQAVSDRDTKLVGTFEVKDGRVVSLKLGGNVVAEGLPQQKWGISTETEVRVRTIMHSPNHWGDSAVGNKHTIFMLEGCKNDQPTRGIYNEFLHGSLEVHRKVFEVLGEKTKCPVVDEQLSGLGFSSTKGDSVMLRVKGEKLNQTYKVVF